MKKVISVFVICYLSLNLSAQFVSGWGVMGGATFARQKWYFNDVDETERKKFKIGFNACVFAEFFSGDYVRWRSEIQYNQKGCIDKRDSVKYKNKIDYICWNNFLVIRKELFPGIPYILIGPRLEYRFKQSTQSPEIAGDFKTLHVSPSIGAGWEFIVYSSLKPFVEIHYNPDIKLNAYEEDPLEIKNRAWELRVGFKYVFNNKSQGEGCAAVYTFN